MPKVNNIPQEKPWYRSPCAGVSFPKAVQIAQPLEAVCEEYDIKEDFDNKHGASNAAAPKVFMKYFFVNTKTGEKSGEMLTLVTLDEDAPVEGE